MKYTIAGIAIKYNQRYLRRVFSNGSTFRLAESAFAGGFVSWRRIVISFMPYLTFSERKELIPHPMRSIKINQYRFKKIMDTLSL